MPKETPQSMVQVQRGRVRLWELGAPGRTLLPEGEDAQDRDNVAGAVNIVGSRAEFLLKFNLPPDHGLPPSDENKRR